jgi:hypothetical protein
MAIWRAGLGKKAEWWLRFSETRFTPYFRWWYSLKTNLIFGAVALIGLAVFYFVSNR